MRPVRALNGSFDVLGSRIPMAVAILLGLTLGGTLFAAIGRQVGWPVLEYGALVPALVWRGQAWRLVTWAFFEFSLAPIGLVFALMCLLSIGRDLCYRWGPRRLLGRYLGLTVATGVLTSLIGFVWPAVMAGGYFTSWATIIALIVAWAIENPHASLVVNFLIPVQGRQIIYANLGLVLLAGIFYGPALIVPEVVAIALTMLYMRDPALYRFWLRLRLASLERSRPRPSHLRPVERDEWGKPPRWLH